MPSIFRYQLTGSETSLHPVENVGIARRLRLPGEVKESIVTLTERRLSVRLAARMNGVTEATAVDVLLEHMSDLQEKAYRRGLMAPRGPQGPGPVACGLKRAA